MCEMKLPTKEKLLFWGEEQICKREYIDEISKVVLNYYRDMRMPAKVGVHSSFPREQEKQKDIRTASAIN